MKMLKTILRFLLPLLVILAGLGIARALISMRKPPQKAAKTEAVTPVTVVTAQADSSPLVLEVAGTIKPARQVELRPQVSGQILEVSPDLQPGGFFEKGQVIATIDQRDYEFMVEGRKAEVERARFELKNEQGRAAVASREWELLGKELQSSEQGRELSLRLPHLRRAEAALKAAESSLADAELQLSRTSITAPFNGQIREELVDPGQVVNPQMMIATLTGTDVYWVQAAVPLDRLGFLSLPDREGKGGSVATVTQEAGTVSVTRKGRVIRLLSDLQTSGRMARLLIAVEDPLGLVDGTGIPLLLDAFVRVMENRCPTCMPVAVPPAACPARPCGATCPVTGC